MMNIYIYFRLYSCLANGSPDEFQRGEHLLRAKCIRNVLQIGFHLCATVQPPQSSINKVTGFQVSTRLLKNIRILLLK